MENKSVFIIAEAGVNHNGSMKIAKQLIDSAISAQADAVKFQTFIAENVISKDAQKAAYQELSTGSEESQLEMVKKLQLSFSDFIELKKYCEEKGIRFLSTAFDLESVDFLKTLDMKLWKIPSGEITNLPYLKKIGGYKEKVIFSTGMASMIEIENALSVLIDAGTRQADITILHCNTEYPTPMKDVNLKAMLSIKNTFGVNVGYSDHTLGIEVPIAAVALGATVIEKHFTLDRNLPGPDHGASLEPAELSAMVKSIRNVEISISGSGIKEPTVSEIPNKIIARKSIYTKNKLGPGHLITENDLIMKRPGDGISPMDVNKVIGRKTIQNLAAETKLKWEYIEK
jgi:N,N'-diacetyllegionaminate synthase